MIGLLLSACSAAEQPKSAPPNWAEAIQLSPRFDPNSGELSVQLKLKPGFHSYTTGETVGRPLKLSLKPGPAALDGPVAYPKGKRKALPTGDSVIVEGEAAVRAKLKPSGAAREGEQQASLRYQVCTDTACDRPRRFEIRVPVRFEQP